MNVASFTGIKPDQNWIDDDDDDDVTHRTGVVENTRCSHKESRRSNYKDYSA